MAPKDRETVSTTTAEPNRDIGSSDQSEIGSDDALLEALGYKPVLHRTYTLLESFSTTFSALYFVGGVRVTFSTGIAAGGLNRNTLFRINYLITAVFTFITAAVIAEICSALPSAGSIYLWAAEAGGPRYGRLLGFVVAWWSTTAWTTFCASNTQSAVNYMLAELTVFNVNFPKNVESIKFRAVQWICTEILLALAAIVNFLPPKYFRWIFYLSSSFVLLDFILNVIWLPIGAHNTWGFRTAQQAFLETYNGTGAPAGWNWCLSFLATAGILIGFDASGHVAEETKNASLTAARGIFWSTIVSGLGAGFTIVLFLFCAPDPETLFSFGSPQPFVPLYAVVLGKRAHIVMNVICVIAYWFNTTIAIVAASRLVFAVARDGVLPFSGWVSRVSPSGQPYNAILVVWGVAALVTCTILPSTVAFTSLVSAAGVPSAAAYGLICLGRVFLTAEKFPKPRWSLGRLSRPCQIIGIFWNAWVVAILFSPYQFPVTGQNLNYAPIILSGVTILALISYWVIPEEKWFPNARISKFVNSQPVQVSSEEPLKASS
ncbi:hypothetical protein LOZ66_000314 [Ophidiomyces ophidiicola]|nr:hypothetical protein LOZ66_000314 [Ophidiomyces ophidiicola]